MPKPWYGAIRNRRGRVVYRLRLVPLWRLEGGIVAFELVLTDLRSPEKNILGERVMDQPQAFVIEMDDLIGGIERSKFGAVRRFALPGRDPSALYLTIGKHRLASPQLESRCGPDCSSPGQGFSVVELHITLKTERHQSGAAPRGMD